MRFCRKAEVAGKVSVTELPDASQQCLNVPAEVLAGPVLRVRFP